MHVFHVSYKMLRGKCGAESGVITDVTFAKYGKKCYSRAGQKFSDTNFLNQLAFYGRSEVSGYPVVCLYVDYLDNSSSFDKGLATGLKTLIQKEVIYFVCICICKQYTLIFRFIYPLWSV